MKFGNIFEKHFEEYRQKVHQARVKGDRQAYARLHNELEFNIKLEADLLLKRLEKGVEGNIHLESDVDNVETENLAYTVGIELASIENV